LLCCAIGAVALRYLPEKPVANLTSTIKENTHEH
jgi:hypothetical protein